MSTERDRRKAKKREKQRKKRDDARRARGSRRPPGAKADVSDAVDWPVGDAWVGEGWHERGARVDALFTRRHADGRVAVAAFELDLAERGVLAVQTVGGASEAAVQGELVRRSSDDRAMVAAEPGLVVRLVRAAAEHGASGGFEPPKGYDAAVALFGDVRPSGDEILCGTEEAPAQPERAGGFLASLKRRLGFGGATG